MVTAPGQTKGCREKIKKEKFNWGYCEPSSPIVFKTASGADEVVIDPDPLHLQIFYEYNLDLSHKKITSIPPEIVILIYLHYLHLNNNQLTTIPPEIGNLENLETLDLHRNQLTTIPKEIGNLANLESLRLRNNQLTTLPQKIGNLAKLRVLHLRNNQLTTLPPEIGNLAKLRYLHLSYNQITLIPPEIGNLTKMKNVYLNNNRLTSIPREIGNLAKLEILHLNENQLTTLPPEIGNLAKLNLLDLSSNQLTSIPPEIGNLVKLEHLQLHRNQLTSILPEIGNLNNLQELYLSNNPIQGVIPDTFRQLHRLYTITLENTDITNVDALRPLLNNHRLTRRNIRMIRNRPGWLGENVQQQIVPGRAFEVHNAFKKIYPHFLQHVFAPLVKQTVHNEDTAKIVVEDSLRSAIDNAMYLADTLTNEKNLPQDTKTIKETLKENLEDLKGKVGNATLNEISNYKNVVQALLRYMVALRNERITREYLSRFTDESLNAYGRKGTSCMAGIRERLSILFPKSFDRPPIVEFVRTIPRLERDLERRRHLRRIKGSHRVCISVPKSIPVD